MTTMRFCSLMMAAVASWVAIAPATAHADGWGRHHRYERGWNDGYDNGRYDGYDEGRRAGYDRGRRDGYHQRRNERRWHASRPCKPGQGTTGAIVGGVAGALLGREIAGDDTVGALIGGGAGALAGRAIDKDGCR
jgi:hypothetical protein